MVTVYNAWNALKWHFNVFLPTSNGILEFELRLLFGQECRADPFRRAEMWLKKEEVLLTGEEETRLIPPLDYFQARGKGPTSIGHGLMLLIVCSIARPWSAYFWWGSWECLTHRKTRNISAPKLVFKPPT